MRLGKLALRTHSSANNLPSPENALTSKLFEAALELEPCQGFLLRENFSTKIIESILSEDLQPTIKICVDGLQSPSLVVKQSAAAKLRLLAKNRVDNRALICESGAFPALIPLLRCSNPWTHEHTITAHTQFAKFQLGFEQGRKKRMDAQGKGAKGVATEHTQFVKFQLGFDLFE
ncbi:U-box domain-containing protein 4-like [Pyrus ussuriensis x Pyrus communis]|uniref:U-box domain-containing protein 4-like n=1 Tax=Pyrus ussuriensis x Pyrus communis TaxID=2448454 RepID=A0A5N5GJ04_9ROSA|nr:U-box domain-containing protein 4-like [Pyrus ussuriensis x Pyrus communis]